MTWDAIRWIASLSFLTVAEVGPSAWVDNPWIQLGAVGCMAVCLLLSLLDNAKARRDWLKQLSEQSRMRRDDAIGIQAVLNRVIEHCSGHTTKENDERRHDDDERRHVDDERCHEDHQSNMIKRLEQ